LNKALSVALANWKEILIVLLMGGLLLKTHSDYKKLERAYEATQTSLQNQIEGMKQIQQRDAIRREESLDEYRKTLEELTENYEENKHQLEVLKSVNRKKYVGDFTDNQDELIEKIKTLYGFEYVK
jgi:ATP-dependent helicase/DNAse subunit B